MLAAGCGKHGKSAPVGGSDIPPSQVKLSRNVELGYVEQRPLEYYVDTVGYLEAEGQTEIAAGVTGIVDEVLFREGHYVDANTILVKVDQKRFVAAAEIARANEQRADENVKLKKDQHERALLARAGTSDEERERLLREYGLARADLLAAKAAKTLAEHNLYRSQVRAPYKGQINQRRVTAGTYLEEKTVIATMADLSHLRLSGWIPERAAPTVRDLMASQDPVRITRLTGACFANPPLSAMTGFVLDQGNMLPGTFGLEFTVLPFPERTFRARLFYMSTTANPDTHMFECKAEVSLAGAGADLRPGFTASIRCPLRSNNAVVIPEEASRISERGWIAFVPVQRTGHNGNTQWFAEERKLELGYRSPGWVVVLKGVQPGERIVRKGAESLENGTPIQFTDE